MKHCRPVSSIKPMRAAQFQSLNELATLISQLLGFPGIILGNFSLLIAVLTGYQGLMSMKASSDPGS